MYLNQYLNIKYEVHNLNKSNKALTNHWIHLAFRSKPVGKLKKKIKKSALVFRWSSKSKRNDSHTVLGEGWREGRTNNVVWLLVVVKHFFLSRMFLLVCGCVLSVTWNKKKFSVIDASFTFLIECPLICIFVLGKTSLLIYRNLRPSHISLISSFDQSRSRLQHWVWTNSVSVAGRHSTTTTCPTVRDNFSATSCLFLYL